MINLQDYRKELSKHDVANFQTWVENLKWCAGMVNVDKLSAVRVLLWKRGNEGPNLYSKGTRLFTVSMKLDQIDPVIDVIKNDEER